MEFTHTSHYTLTPLHADRFGRAKPSCLLRFAQDAAEAHCLLLGTDWNTMAEKNLFWAVIRQRIEILRLPREGETITVKTWPMPTTKVAYPRATEGFDSEGNCVFKVISLWVIMDMTTRVMIRPDRSGVEVHGITLGSELKAPAGLSFRNFTQSLCRTVGFTELDINGHMNNTRYADWLCDLVDSSFHKDHPVKAITICYLNEAKEGQQICLRWSGDPCLQAEGAVAAADDAAAGHSRIFTAQMEF